MSIRTPKQGLALRESHLCSIPSDPTGASRIADEIRCFFALQWQG